MSKASFPGHINFALSTNEIMVCVVCGRPPRERQGRHDQTWCQYVDVTPVGRYPINGVVGVCWCVDKPVTKKSVIGHWRQKAPKFIRIFKDLPIQLVARGYCDDVALAQAIRDAFDKVPLVSRSKILDYVLSSPHYSTTGKGMRFEALGRWPRMGDCSGMNMDWGHAIRLRASYVNHATNESLIETIAHELAHTEQKADNRRFDTSEESELDVESRLRSWGFDVQTAKKDDIKELLLQVDEIIRLAKELKTKFCCSELPSSNSSHYALLEANKAKNMLLTSLHRLGCYEES